MKAILIAAVISAVSITLGSCGVGGVIHAKDCKALEAAVVTAHQDISILDSTSYAISAPQATQLATEIANKLAIVKINLDLMRDHNCPMPTVPVVPETYASAARACATAKEGSREQLCDRAHWPRSGLTTE
jgi:hypothetical protein